MPYVSGIADALGLSPQMMIRSVVGLDGGGSFGPLALTVMAGIAVIFGRQIFVVVMTHVRITNPFTTMSARGRLLTALVAIPLVVVVMNAPGLALQRLEARVLAPLGLTPGTHRPVERVAAVASGGCLPVRLRVHERQGDDSFVWTHATARLSDGCTAEIVRADWRNATRPRPRPGTL